MQEEKRELFRIGEVARLFGLSVGTLRHYEKIGLLPPEFVDPQTGYRYYSTRQFESLNTIRYLRALDMPLEEIVGFLRDRDVEKMTGLLLRQKEIVQRKRHALDIISRKIDRRLQQIQDARRSVLDQIRLLKIPGHRVAWIRNEVTPSTYLDLETSIRQLETGQESAMVFLGKVGVGITRESLERKAFARYELVFLLLEEEDDFSGPCEYLSDTLCAVVRFCGEHRDAAAYYHRLDAFLERHGLAIAGFSREITMIDYGLTGNREEFVTEIQIPVQPLSGAEGRKNAE